MSTRCQHDRIDDLACDGSSTPTYTDITRSPCSEEHKSGYKQVSVSRETKLSASRYSRWPPFYHRNNSPTHLGPHSLDLEKIETTLEHVVLKFQGADCAGCANKIFKCLGSLPDLLGLRTNPILLQAEFDLNTRRTSVTDVIDCVRNTTGYNCERITKTWHEVEAIVPDKFEGRIGTKYPTGVKEVVSRKNVVKILYDAEAIGARDLLETGFGFPIILAPARVHNEATNQLRKAALLTFISSILTIPILVLSWAPLPPHKIAYGSLSLALATIIQGVIAGPLYSVVIRSLFRARTIDMNLLVVLSTTAAYVVSVVSFIHDIQGVEKGIGLSFETSALLVTLIMVGRLATAYTYQRAMKSASIRSLQPTKVVVVNLRGSGKSTAEELDVRLLQRGDEFKVEPDSPIVTDGRVISGLSYIDESMLTGESCLVEKKKGSSVIAGSVNRSDTLLVEVSRLPGSNTIDEIATMVDEVNFSKPKTQELADQFASYFVPAIGIIALLTFSIWALVGKLVQHHPGRTALLNALPYAITVLVVSCPCAIGLAVPMVMVIACSLGAQRGIVVKSAGALEIARKVTHVVFDKTGTLTDSHLAISVENYLVQPASFPLSLALGLTASSKHPVAATVAKHVQALGLEPAFVGQVRTLVGKGVTGIINEEIVCIGNAGWLGVEDHAAVKPLLSQGYTVSCITKGNELLAIFGLSASLREDASATISQLIQRGIEISILSGDDTGAVHKIATTLQIPLNNTRSRCSPAEKQQYIKALMAQPTKPTILFCGDGTNDSAALAQADVGICISHDTGNEGNGATAAAAAESASDVVMMRPYLARILTLIDLSRDVSRRIQFNFVWSALYNLVAILFAAGAFVNVRLPPAYAGLGEIVSVVPVVLVALQMKWKK